ncbi:MAG TPA: M1 family aminopeptidase [Terriglobales bacterium]|nr:M1 family aminopeptidase [Terriglobales bacterium]
MPRIPSWFWCAIVALLTVVATAQAPAPPPAPATPPGPATALYLRLRSVGLDATHVYNVRDAVLDREGVQFIFDDGTIAFTQAVDGHITGAFFEGDGEMLLSPPDQVERASLARFTGSPILTEKFSSAYLRFSDDVFRELQPYLWKAEGAEFVSRWDAVARTLAEPDALRLLLSYTNQPPRPLDGAPDESPEAASRMLHARVTGETLGTFEVRIDALLGESVAAGQIAWRDGNAYYDLWTSFPGRSRRTAATGREVDSGFAPEAELRVSGYRIRAEVKPPTRLEAEAELDMEVSGAGRRLLGFELSRYLRVESVTADGQPLELIQNEALRGTELARRGNDLVAVVFPQPIPVGRKITLRFRYGGDVLSDAGGGLLYVGARGTWFPNRGMAMGDFDLEFRYPEEWTLVATGRRVSMETKEGFTVSRWTSDRPIPMAGFNLGRYESARAEISGTVIETYAARSVEDAFPRSSMLIRPPGGDPRLINLPRAAVAVPAARPQPARNAQQLADRTARSVEFLSRRLGPFPYRQLSITQMPGRNSQGWPGLIFLSSYSFLTPEERSRAGLGAVDVIRLGDVTPAHETAHQWWGDLILWHTYRDQWVVEAVCNYLALLELEEQKPDEFRKLMDSYRDELLQKSAAGGGPYAEAGPVTLGLRLSSSRFPDGYDVVAYGRGTWLFHMLRHLLRNTAGGREADALFFQVLRRLRERHEGRDLSTADLQQAFEEVLPPALRFEGRSSLGWFFEGWVRGTAVPRLELADVRFERRGSKTFATGKIVQKDAPDQLITSVPIYAQAARGAPVFLGRVFADGTETEFRISVPGAATRLLLDPNSTVLRRP